MSPIKQEAINDTQFTDEIIKEIGPHHMTFENGMSIDIAMLKKLPIMVGDTVRLFGRGLGYSVRGMGLVRNGVLVALGEYRTAAEEEAAFLIEQAKSKAKKQAAWDADLPKTLARIERMPLLFQDRIKRFMLNPAWGPEFGPYEMFVCEEAIKIATVASKVGESKKFIDKFSKANVETQKLLVPLEYEEHSGNTFGAAVMLARIAIKHPLLVAHAHGALCPLVGCEDYGCYAASPEARAARET